MPLTLQGSNAVNVLADSATSALKTTIKGSTKVGFSETSPGVDAFGRLRVSEPRVVFECSFANNAPATLWEATAYGVGTKTANTTAWQTELNTTTAASTGYWIQSWNHVRCAPGISTLVRFTFNFSAFTDGLTSRVGLFSDQGTFPSTQGDGVYLEAADKVVSLVVRTLGNITVGSEIRILQKNWSLDPMDGTGPSGVSLNWTFAQHLVIDFKSLGAGNIRFGFETSQGLVWVHTFNSTNVLSSMWSRVMTLPVRAEIFTTSAVSFAGKLVLFNCVVLQEGDVEWRAARHRSWGTFTSAVSVTTGALSTISVFSLRPVTSPAAAVRPLLIPTNLTVQATAIQAGSAHRWVIYWGGTLSAGGFGALSDGAELDSAISTSIVTTGIPIISGMLPTALNKIISIDLSPYKDNLLRASQNAAGSLTTAGNNILSFAIECVVTAALSNQYIVTIGWKEIV